MGTHNMPTLKELTLPILLGLSTIIFIASIWIKKKKGVITIPTKETTDFVGFICEAALKNNVAKTKESISTFVLENFRGLSMVYVAKTHKALVVNNVPRLIRDVTKRYLK